MHAGQSRSFPLPQGKSHPRAIFDLVWKEPMCAEGRAAVLAKWEEKVCPCPAASEKDMGFVEGTPVLYGSGNLSWLG